MVNLSSLCQEGKFTGTRFSRLRQIGHGTRVFDEFLEGSHDCGASEQFAEKVDFAAKLIVRDRLDKFLSGRARHSVILGDLGGGRTGDAEGLAFSGKLRHQAHRLCASRVDRSPGKKQVPYESIAKIAFQARDTAEAGNESKAQLGKSKPRHFVGDDHVTGQGQLKSSTKTSAMNGSDGDKWRGIDHVQNGVDAFQKGAHACGALFRRDCRRGRV